MKIQENPSRPIFQQYVDLEIDWSKYVKTDKKYIRPAEVPHLLGDPKKANEKLGWKTNTSFDDLVNMMVDADLERYV